MTTCRDCKRALRPYGTKASDYPGTVGKHSKEQCSACYLTETRNAERASLEAAVRSMPRVEDRMRVLAPGVHKLITRRRNNGVPAKGKTFVEGSL